MRAHRVLAAALAGTCACSFVAVRGPPRELPPAVEPRCTETSVAPGLDTAGAIITPLTGAFLWGLCSFSQVMQSWASDPKELSCNRIAWAALAATAAYAGSAVYGFHATSECRKLVEQRRGITPGDRPGPTQSNPRQVPEFGRPEDLGGRPADGGHPRD